MQHKNKNNDNDNVAIKRNNNNNNKQQQHYKLKLVFLISVLFCIFLLLQQTDNYYMSSSSSSSAEFIAPITDYYKYNYNGHPSVGSSSSEEAEAEEIYGGRGDTLALTRTSTSSSTTNNKRKRTKIIHVMNTYTISTKNNTSRTQPFDQWATLKSIERAMKHVHDDDNNNNNIVNDIDVDFVCAIFESDLPYLIQNENDPNSNEPNLPCNIITVLKRSTKTEYTDTDNVYHNFLKGSTKELPFIQDIIDSAITDYYNTAAVRAAKDKAKATKAKTIGNDADDDVDVDVDDFYIMYTNSDIGLTKEFYSNLIPKLDNKEALSINRITIKASNKIENISNQYYNNYNNISNNNNTNDNSNNNSNNNLILLNDMLSNEIDTNIHNGKRHPGKDCFIVHSTVLKRIHMGNLFAGQTPWGNMYHSMLSIMAMNYTNYKSSTIGTYHIGSKREWNKGRRITKKKIDKLKIQLKLDSRLLKDNYCAPSPHPGPYANLNKINSCLLWLNNNNNNNTLVPNFVKTGYEEFYINQINSLNLCSDTTYENNKQMYYKVCSPI
jgi:hypothetical protein